MKILTRLFFLFLVLSTLQFSCEKDTAFPKYKTKNAIVVIMDGARYSETWGDLSHQYIQRTACQLAPEGTVYTEFYNNGPTYTLAGHTSITTGFYQEIENTGKEFPKYPSMFQCWNQTYKKDHFLSWIITSKDKLDILGNCQDTAWKGRYTPSTNCGVNGSGTGSGYRLDSLTLVTALALLSEHHPQLTLINFAEPDNSGHSGNWNNYLKGISTIDEYAYRIWEFIQTDSYYKGTTAFFLTNDHGRHLDSVSDGFINHGDNCAGCRHINCYAFGPDFKKGAILDMKRELIDIPVTIAELMHFSMPYGQGVVMTELFETKK